MDIGKSQTQVAEPVMNASNLPTPLDELLPNRSGLLVFLRHLG